ncbi:hypothetical protein HHL22_11465 [Hymenobacter sp. RP-2-7]|uniref:Uncharacterized protein n=1 Tax=Hymenobacter polaris TaxID=2682546 RepID=A0A7Y0AEQ6_9BACT|nr:DUF6252 family protein [Hymenobacter polaris]NML65822.1 hypothetical protein [Hymenobacter polaris]
MLLATACSKDKATPAPANSWQVDGQAQQAAKVTVEVGTPAMNAGMLTIHIWQDISNANSTGSAVAVYLFVPNRVGTYSLTAASTSASAGYSDYVSPGAGSNLYEATSGSVTITALTSNSVTGTFTFTAAEVFTPQHTRQITNGQFSTTF